MTANRTLNIALVLMLAGAGVAHAEELVNQQVVSYAIDLLRVRPLWSLGRGNGINVAMVDTGVDHRHPDLAAGIAGGWNFINDNDQYFDDFMHGTLGAGIIGARDNGIGTIGIAPESRIWALRISGEEVNPNGSKGDELERAANWVLQKKMEQGGHWVVTIEYAVGYEAPGAAPAIQRLIDADVVVVASAGNYALTYEGTLYPAGYPGVIGVGATDERGDVTVYSSPGPHVAVVAPGNNVVTTAVLDQGTVAWINAGGERFFGTPMHYRQVPNAGGGLVDAGIGRPEEFGAQAPGFVAVVRRSDALTFEQQGRNAVAAGAGALVIMNDPVKPFPVWNFSNSTPEDRNFPWPFGLAVSYEEGMHLLRYAGQPASSREVCCDYSTAFGTSYSAPHVAGVAALLWSIVPHATAKEISNAIIATARDIGPPGLDPSSGHGLVDAIAALRQLNPDLTFPRRRGVRH